MIPVPAWLGVKALAGFFTPQRIIAIVAAIALAVILWNIKSTYAERDKLLGDVKVQQAQIQSLGDAVKNKEDIINEMRKRIELIGTVTAIRAENVNKEKGKSQSFINKGKETAEKIKKTDPSKLPAHYEGQYNKILDCVEEVTNVKESSC